MSIVDRLTKEQIREMSPQELGFWFQQVQEENTANQMRKFLLDQVDMNEANVTTLKFSGN